MNKFLNKSILGFIIGLALVPTAVFAVPTSWDWTGSILRPLQSMWGAEVRVDHIVATSTTATSTFPNASSTTFCLGSDCRTVWPSGGTISTSTGLADTQVVFATGPNTIGSEAAFNYSSTLDRLIVPYASTSKISVGSWTLGTSSLTANTLLLTNGGYPSVIVGADDASPVANFEINSQSQGDYTSFGLKNGANSGALVYDTVTSLGGIAPNLILNNITGGGTCLLIPHSSGNGSACLRTYNGLGAIFNVLAPYNASGQEANLSTSMVNSDGSTNTIDWGIQEYGGSFPTGKMMYVHALASDLNVSMPTISHGFWNQGYGNTSNATSSWGYLAASTTQTGTYKETTVVAIGDAWNKGYSKAGGINFGPSGVEDGTGATVQVLSSTTRQKALEVFSRNGVTNTSLMSVFNAGKVAVGATSTAENNLEVYASANPTIGLSTGAGNNNTIRNTAGVLQFNTAGGNSFTWQQSGTERMRLLTGGNFGVGSTSPEAKAVIQNANSTNSFIVEDQASDATPFRIDAAGAVTTGGSVTTGGNVNAYTGGTPGTGLFFFIQGDGSTGINMGAINSSFQRVAFDASPLVLNGRVGSTGNVGIGTSTSPTYELQVTGQGTTHPLAVASSTGTVMLNVLANGNVGIGTSTPGDKLTVAVGNTQGIEVLSTNSGFVGVGKNSADRFRIQNDFTNTGLFEILYNDGAGNPASTNAFTITGTGSGIAGRVGIGTTTPASKFTTSGTVTHHALTAAAGTPNSLCVNAVTKEVTENAALTCTVSDEDQKTPLEELTFDALGMIAEMEPSSFYYKDNLNRERYGFGAQSLQKIDPRLADGYDDQGIARSIDLAALIALNTKAIQELAERDTEPVTNHKWLWLALLALAVIVARQQFQINKLNKSI